MGTFLSEFSEKAGELAHLAGSAVPTHSQVIVPTSSENTSSPLHRIFIYYATILPPSIPFVLLVTDVGCTTPTAIYIMLSHVVGTNGCIKENLLNRSVDR